MLELLPPYLRRYSEMEGIMNVENGEITTINNIHNQLVDNRYIMTCNETGILHFEKMLGVSPLNSDTLDDRKLRCIAKWNQVLPYNFVVLKKKLASLCGSDGYSLDIDFEKMIVTVKIALGVKNQFDIVKEMVNEMMPCNMVTEISLKYNTYGTLKAYTHEQLAKHTHIEIREEFI